MDVMSMTYKTESFDVVLDKSTLDAILCGEESFLAAARMLNEIQRVLKTGGIYMIISYGSPSNRLSHLKRPHLSFDIECFVMSSHRPIYPPSSPSSSSS